MAVLHREYLLTLILLFGIANNGLQAWQTSFRTEKIPFLGAQRQMKKMLTVRLEVEPKSTSLHMVLGEKTKEDTSKKALEKKTGGGEQPSVEETTEKYGLEAGLFQSLKQGGEDGGKESAQSLLKKYGVAYLATSIPLAIVSFAICYALVDAGVDVSSLLSNVGIDAGATGDKVGTVAIAYAAHKAASPLRFPPTVLLTPFVAKLIGKEVNEEGGEEKE